MANSTKRIVSLDQQRKAEWLIERIYPNLSDETRALIGKADREGLGARTTGDVLEAVHRELTPAHKKEMAGIIGIQDGFEEKHLHEFRIHRNREVGPSDDVKARRLEQLRQSPFHQKEYAQYKAYLEGAQSPDNTDNNQARDERPWWKRFLHPEISSPSHAENNDGAAEASDSEVRSPSNSPAAANFVRRIKQDILSAKRNPSDPEKDGP